jgi:uncharacterized Zn finger protein
METTDLRDLYSKTSSLVEQTLREAEAMDALVDMAEERRTARSESKRIEVLSVESKGATVEGRVKGVSKVYDVCITLAPRRAFRCTCPDSKQRGRHVGPCKHTIALAREHREKLQPELTRLYDTMVNFLF